jgi:hypothetical protein
VVRTRYSLFRAARRVVEYNHPQMVAMQLQSDAHSCAPGANRVGDFTTTTVSSISPSAAGPDSSERRLPATNRRARDGAEPSQRCSQTSKSLHITSAVRSMATTMTSLPVNTKIHTADHADNL